MKDLILEKLSLFDNLPPFPDLLVKLQEKIEDPEVSVREVAAFIEMDPAIAGRILKIANSSYFGGLQEVRDVRGAVLKLGMEFVRESIISIGLSRLFQGQNRIDHFQFWRHSLAVAIFTRSLSRYISAGKDVANLAYLSGLMHDIGILIFFRLVPEAYREFLCLPACDKSLAKREKEYFGIDHPKLGALFIQKWWHLDKRIEAAVRYHHFPFNGSDKERRCAQLVNVANGICNSQGITNGICSVSETFENGAWEELGFELSNVTKILSDVRNALEQATDLLSDG